MTDGSVPRGPSLTDVATLAGVSHQTVSRVVNMHPNVSDATRVKVRAAISELGYRPNAAARWLATGRTHSIGVLAGELGQYGPSSVLMGIQDAAQAEGYFLTVVTLRDYSESAVDIALRGLLNHGVEGVIAITPHVSALEVVAKAKGSIPLVTVGGGSGKQNDVALDQESGSRQAVGHLVGLGHLRIAHLAGPLDWVDARRRVDGWRTAMDQHGLQPGELLEGDWSAESGYRVGRTLEPENGPSAVIAGNDQMALGLMKALRERGLDVPRDISIIGFDDVPGAEFWEPSLTTIRQELGEVGGSSIRLLISTAAGHPVDGILPAPRLILRSSTARHHDR